MPLRLRLRNPPALFVGREREVLELERSIRRSSVSFVWGFGGLGKTSLVLHTLHRMFPERVGTTIMVRAGESGGDIRLELFEALRDVRPKASLPAILSDPELLLASAIDLADEDDRWMVIDDFHNIDPNEAAELVVALASYARRAKWIITSRVALPGPHLAGCVLELRGLDPVSLGDLATEIAGGSSREAREAAVRAAAGSPWRLLQVLRGGTADDTAVLDGVSESGRSLLMALCVLDVPAPEPAFATLVDLPDASAIDDFLRRGLVERSGEGLRVHDVARSILRGLPSFDFAGWAARVAGVLAGSDSPSLRVEAIRLYVDAKRNDLALDLLERHLEELVDGHAGRLFRVLENVDEQPFEHAKLACAQRLGGGTALRWAVDHGRPRERRDRLVWSHLLLIDGQLALARDEARSLRVASKGSVDRIAFEAGLIEAHATCLSGSAEQATALLRRLAPESTDEAARRDARLARACLMNGQFDEALALTQRLAALSLQPATRAFVEAERLSVLSTLGHHDQADELFAEEDGATFLPSRWAMLNRLTCTIETGRLSEARETLAKLEPYVRSSPIHRPLFAINALRVQMSSGDYDGIAERIDGLVEEARCSNTEWYAWLTVARTYLALQLARDNVDAGWSREAPPPLGQAPLIAAFECLHAARFGRPMPTWPSWRSPSEFPEVVDVAITARMAAAVQSAMSSDPDGAKQWIGSAIDLAKRHHCVLYEADAHLLACEIFTMLGDADAAAVERNAIADLGETLPAPRLLVHHRLFAELAADTPDPRELRAIAADGSRAPVAARLARAIVAGAPLAGLEASLVASVRARAGWTVVELRPTCGAEASSDWGIDSLRRCAWRGNTRIELAGRDTSFRFLEVLAEQGGAASKETLSERVWNITRYHPLRDDKRIQVTVRRLRLLVEDDPTNPTRLVTTPDGYAIGEAAGCLWLRSKASPFGQSTGHDGRV